MVARRRRTAQPYESALPDARQQSEPYALGVVAITLELVVEKSILERGATDDRSRVAQRDEESEPRAEGQRARRRRHQHAEVTRMPHDAIGPRIDEPVAAFGLDAHGNRKEP